MSDTLQQKLRGISNVIGLEWPPDFRQHVFDTCREAAARIAELEEEVSNPLSPIELSPAYVRGMKARIAELEAEVARLDAIVIEQVDHISTLEPKITRQTARIVELEEEVRVAHLAFGRLVARHTRLDPGDIWDALMNEIHARPAL